MVAITPMTTAPAITWRYQRSTKLRTWSKCRATRMPAMNCS